MEIFQIIRVYEGRTEAVKYAVKEQMAGVDKEIVRSALNRLIARGFVE